jgi:hypothetical protein
MPFQEPLNVQEGFKGGKERFGIAGSLTPEYLCEEKQVKVF